MISRTFLAAALTAGALTWATPAIADPLIASPGAWPPPPTVAPNPLAATTYTLNGGRATPYVRWTLGFGRQRRPTVMQTIGRQTLLHGTLYADDGVMDGPITSATLTVLSQPAGTSTWTPIGTTITSQHGGFRFVLPPDGHRRIAMAYWPAVGSVAPVFSRRVLVKVRSRVWLGQPHRQRGAYRFRGRVNGGLIGGDGVLVALQVHNNQGNWVSVRIGRTLPSGRFVLRYRMPPGRYRMRVVAPAQSALPLYAGRSRPVRVGR